MSDLAIAGFCAAFAIATWAMAALCDRLMERRP